jgi:UDP-glucuronate 4-epimerase
MAKILITGAAGFIGSHLKSELKNFHQITGVDDLNSMNLASKKRVDYFGNIINGSIHSNFIDSVNEKPEIVVHLAAETGISSSLSNPSLYFHQNVEGTFNVLEQCRKNGVKFLIYASSSSVYEPNQSVMTENSPHDKQLSFYGTSKRLVEIMVENYCRQFGITAIGLRFFTVYGSWTRPDMAAYRFMKAIDEGKEITLYNDGKVYRDFTHVSDIVESIRLLIEKISKETMGSHQIFNIGNGSPVSVKEYANLIAKYLNKEMRSKSESLPSNELEFTNSDSSKLEQYINYKPTCNVVTGIQEMTDWFKRNRYE